MAIAVELSDNESVVVDQVMFATGRKPNIDGLGPGSSRREARRERRHRGR